MVGYKLVFNTDFMLWQRLPQEREGSYSFEGELIVTNEVYEALSEDEIKAIVFDLRKFVLENGTVNYLQVYQHKTDDRKIYLIDNVTKMMRTVLTDKEREEEDYFTMLFDHEY